MKRLICSLVLVALMGTAAFAGHSRVGIKFSFSQPAYVPPPVYYPAPVYSYPSPVYSCPPSYGYQPGYGYAAPPAYYPAPSYGLSFSWGGDRHHYDRSHNWYGGHGGWRGHR